MARQDGYADLGAFVSALGSGWMTDDPTTRHRRLVGSLMSADLSGFTAMSDRLAEHGREGAEALTLAVNDAFSALIARATSEGGDVLKFGGDALLVWFDGSGHEQRAVRAGAAMQRALRSRRLSRHGLQMSIGIHSGDVDVFLVGGEYRSLTLCGSSVTQTVRLEARAQPEDVLVSAATAAALPASWCLRRHRDSILIDQDAVPRSRRQGSPHATVGPDLTHLFAPGLVDLMRSLGTAGGEHRLATIAFLEIDGTDAMVADHDPVHVADFLDAVVRTVQEAAHRYGVTFLYTDVVEDGVKFICTAGAPVTTGDDEDAMLHFATDLVHQSAPLPMRAGVNRGRVFAGFLGGAERRTYTVMGDPVNLAARLLGRAELGQVLSQDAVVARTRSMFQLTPLAPFLVKGKSAPVTAHLVRAPVDGQQRVQRLVDLPLVGREPELATFRKAVDRVASGVGAVVELVGDAGVGKTRLVRAATDDPRLLVRLRVECQPYDSLTPYAGLRPLLRAALGIAQDASDHEAGMTLAERTRHAAPDLLPLLPLIAVPVGASAGPTPESDAIANEFRNQRTHQAVIDLLTAVLRAVTLFEVEDVYYIDEASFQLLRVLASAVPTRPWLLVLTRRPDGQGIIATEADGLLMKVQPLGDDDAGRLVELALGGSVATSSHLDAVIDRSGGNPLFVLELIAATEAGTASDELPESIERLVAARIDRLPPEPRMALRQAAVLGRVFSTAVLDRLRAHEGLVPLGPAMLAQMVELLDEVGPGEYRFHHALFRDVAYEGLPYRQRRSMHATVGQLLEASDHGAPTTPALLSLHFWLGGDRARAWRYSVVAGHVAWDTHATTEAIAAYQRALEVRRGLRGLDLLEVAEVGEALGDALERAGRYEDARRAYDVARRTGRTLQPTHQRARLLRKIGVLHEREGQYESALGWHRRSLDEAALDPGRRAALEVAAVMIARAGVLNRLGRHGEVIDEARQALRQAELTVDVRLQAHAHLLIQAGMSDGGHANDGSHGKRALELFESLGDVVYQGKALNNLGIDRYLHGRWTEAADAYEAAIDCCTRTGDVVEAASATNNLGEIRSDQGRFDEAIALFESAIRSWTASNYPIGIALATANLGRVAARSGDHDRARDALADALARFSAIGATGYMLETRVRQAEALLMAGQSDDCLTLVDELLAELDTRDAYPGTAAALHRIRGWARAQRGEVASALGDLGTALAEAARDNVTHELLLARVALAELGGAMDDPQAGQTGTGDVDEGNDIHTLGIVALPRVPLPL